MSQIPTFGRNLIISFHMQVVIIRKKVFSSFQSQFEGRFKKKNRRYLLCQVLSTSLWYKSFRQNPLNEIEGKRYVEQILKLGGRVELHNFLQFLFDTPQNQQHQQQLQQQHQQQHQQRQPKFEFDLKYWIAGIKDK